MTKYHVRQAFDKAARKVCHPVQLELGSSEYQSITNYKPGGTAIIVQGDSTGRITLTDSDKYGRWSYVQTTGANDSTNIFITAYQVCRKPTNRTGITAFHQQQAAFITEKRSNLNPRYNFRQDLIAFIQLHQRRGHNIILMGDFNEHIQDNHSFLQQISLQCNLLDIWKQKFPTAIEPSTYLRGKRRIDYILITQAISPAVAAIGYEPFHHTLATDHRGIFIDFYTDKLFGNATNPLPAARHRPLQSKYPECRKSYIREATSHAHENNLFTRLTQLIQSHDRDDNLIETLDKLLGECCALGERRCTKTRPEWWNTQIYKLRKWRRILQKQRSAFMNHKDFTEPLTQEIINHGIEDALPTTLAATLLALTKARQDIHAAENNSRQLRTTENAARIALERNLNHLPQAKILSNIHNEEQRGDTYRMFKTIRGKNNRSGLSDVDVPDSWPPPHALDDPAVFLDDAKQWDKDNKAFKTVTIPEEIDLYLRARNQRHFGQAEGTPFTQAPLAEILSWEGDTHAADLILQGDYSNDELDDITQLLLKHCQYVSSPDVIKPELTLDEFTGKLRIWRESTSTSPSGRHLGHYKALCRPIAYACEPHDQDELEESRLALLQAHLDIINYCLRHGYSLTRWQDVVNVMILKEANNHRIHRLRVLHLFEADYNLILGVKWRQLMRHAESNKTLNDGQYGSRSGREATGLNLLEVLKNEISNCSRKPLLNLDNDASSCYDRIIVSLSSLINRKYGQHRQIVVVNASTLKQAKYKLKTDLGISATSYSHCTIFPLHGTGQGSGNSPMIWCFISSTLFDCHQAHAFGATFESPDRTVTITFSMVGFVDDSTGSVNDFHNNLATVDSLLSRLQVDAQLWNDLLWCSGGMLELPKCSYHFLFFDFDASGKPLPRPGTVGPPLEVTSPSGHKIPIPFKNVYTTHKTLGHYQAPAGTGKTQLLKIQTTQSTLSQYLASSPANHAQASIFYHTIYLPSIYVLPQSFFTPKELDNAEKKSMPVIFAKEGFNRNTSRALLYGPSDYAGGGHIRWKWMQGEGQIMNFLKYWRIEGQISTVLRVAVSWYQAHAGVSFSLFADVHTPVLYSDSRWLHSLRAFLSSIDGHFDLDQTFIPKTQRQGDDHLMDIAIRSGAFDASTLRIINQCRLHLNVVTVSDITTADGTQLIPGIEWGETDFLPSTSNDHTPIQQAPAIFFWTYWQRLLRAIARPTGALYTPLGPWTLPGSELRRTWNAYFDIKYKFLYLQRATQWHQYELFDMKFLNGIPCTWKPTDTSVPVTAEEHSHDCWTLTYPPMILHPPSPVMIAETFHEYIAQLPTNEHHLFADLQLLYSPYEILQLINLRPLTIRDALFAPSATDASGFDVAPSPEPPPATWKLMLVSDGSELTRHMTFGWVLCLADGTRLAVCSGPAFGQGSSHRAEATGMLSGAQFLQLLQQFCASQILRPTIFITDNKGLLMRIIQRCQYSANYATATLAPDWDLLEQIYDAIQDLAIPPTFQHIKGHQDDTVAYEKLSLPAQLNVDADHEAGNFQWNNAPTQRAHVPMHASTRAQFHVAGSTITGHYRHHIRSAASSNEFFAQCQDIHTWTPTTFQLISLPTLRSAVRNQCHRSKFIFKYLHGILPTQATKAIWDKCSDACPSCLEPDTQTHFLRCMHSSAAQWRTSCLRNLRAKLTALQTSHELLTVLVDVVEVWFDGEQINPCNYPRLYRSAITEQQLIGWHAFLQGYWSTQWEQLQDAHLRRIHEHNHKLTGKIWATQTISTLWQQIFEGWELHNTLVHGTKQKTADLDLRRRIISKVYHLHSRRHEVLADHVEYLFLSDLTQTIRTATLNFLRNWIRLYEPSILESIRVARSNSVKNTRSLCKYFRALSSKRPPKPRFDPRQRLQIDGRQKVRKRRKKILQNPTRNRITRHFTPRPRTNSTPQPRRQLISTPLIPNLRNPYEPFHPTQNPRQQPIPEASIPQIPTPPRPHIRPPTAHHHN